MDQEPTNRTATEADYARKASIADRSVVDNAVAGNEELVSAIEKQVEVLYSRLTPVSSRVPTEGTTDEAVAGVRGNSPLVEKLASETYRLRNISDRLSSITRELEI